VASWKDLRKFLENDGYVLKRHGKDDIYEKTLPNGEIKRVRVSKGTGEISKGLFSRILKQQLDVDKEVFNDRLSKKSK
jgi:predicted RNA binding protein YcfA (HicA-like mRNA interferase family)